MKTLKIGDKVKYVGKYFPSYFGKVYEIEFIISDYVLGLTLPKEERTFYELENWVVSSFCCCVDDVEVEEMNNDKYENR